MAANASRAFDGEEKVVLSFTTVSYAEKTSSDSFSLAQRLVPTLMSD